MTKVVFVQEVVFISSLFSGFVAGFFGFFPFVHSNTLISFFESAFQDPVFASVFFVSLAASSLVFSCFPAVFFGLPSPAQSVSVLPSHALAIQGRGFAALKTMLYSMFFSVIVSLLISPFFGLTSSSVYALVRPFTLAALVLVLLFFFLSETSWKKRFFGLLVFGLSGAFGFVVLGFSLVREPLLPLLTGLFGLPILISSFAARGRILKQVDEAVKVSPKTILFGTLLGAASVFLPAMSPAVLASTVFLLFRDEDRLSFISLSTAIAASKLVFDLQAVFSFGKARSGVAAAVLSRTAEVGSLNWVLLPAMAIAFFLAIGVVFFSYPTLIGLLNKLSQTKISLLVLLAVSAGVLLSTGPMGVAVLVVAGAIGLLPTLLKIRLAYSVGALITPALIYYSGTYFAFTSIIYSS